jgi:hypothetical protein
MIILRGTFAAISCVLTSSIAYGHPGHGGFDTENTVPHYLFSPLHLLPWIVSVLAIIAFLLMVRGSNLVRQSRLTST